ncbi:signal peptide, CUB and EGF-like domain-containing protein 2 [Branchiostoma floridae]|uniref:Signal peptide, CUB and EGF-like domain-containing protein 2 n=1 Tax=Branchiostoma floridae TaxID=7739 RepID=A0A9J7LYK8_BRAFL|nr:signal peptide, CUB and EGF-like domain-containing protein 2 [Branchiostoma floridae]
MLLPPINGGLSGTNFYMDTVVFTCDVGYDLIGDPSSTCQADRSWSRNVPSCSDIDECLNANGGCDHACTNTAGSFYCSCVAGFTLNEDRFSCDDINECNFGNGGCQHNCHNVIGSFQCSCMIGYELSADGFACCVCVA